MFSNAEERKDTAKDAYQKAANCFKLAKQCISIPRHPS